MHEGTNQQIQERCDVQREQAVTQQTNTLEKTNCTTEQLSVDCYDCATKPNYYKYYFEEQSLVVSVCSCG